MTIAAGFMVRDGVVLCTDTRYSVGGAKLPGTKLTAAEIHGTAKLIFAFAGNVDFAQATIQKCIADLRARRPEDVSSSDTVARAVEDILGL